MCLREEKSEQLLDCRQDLDNMEAELKKLQQEVLTNTFYLYIFIIEMHVNSTFNLKAT